MWVVCSGRVVVVVVLGEDEIEEVVQGILLGILLMKCFVMKKSLADMRTEGKEGAMPSYIVRQCGIDRDQSDGDMEADGHGTLEGNGPTFWAVCRWSVTWAAWAADTCRIVPGKPRNHGILPSPVSPPSPGFGRL